MRTFIALEMPIAIEDQLSSVVDTLRKDLERVPLKWMEVENIHLTLKFMGDTPDEHVKQISSLLQKIAGEVRPFNLQLDGFGVFPDRRKPLVVWVGIAESAGLADLQEKIEAALTPLGYDSEHRKFNAHLTLARVRRTAGRPDAERIIAAMDAHPMISSDPVLIDSVTLFESVLSRSGSRYNRLFTALLSGAD